MEDLRNKQQAAVASLAGTPQQPPPGWYQSHEVTPQVKYGYDQGGVSGAVGMAIRGGVSNTGATIKKHMIDPVVGGAKLGAGIIGAAGSGLLKGAQAVGEGIAHTVQTAITGDPRNTIADAKVSQQTAADRLAGLPAEAKVQENVPNTQPLTRNHAHETEPVPTNLGLPSPGQQSAVDALATSTAQPTVNEEKHISLPEREPNSQTPVRSDAGTGYSRYPVDQQNEIQTRQPRQMVSEITPSGIRVTGNRDTVDRFTQPVTKPFVPGQILTQQNHVKSPLEISHENWKGMSINQVDQSESPKISPDTSTVRVRGLTAGQQDQLNRDRVIKSQRIAEDAANKLAQIKEQNTGNVDVANLNAASSLARENISQAGATQRQGMADSAGLQQTQLKETAETGRNKVTNDAAMSRLVTGHGQTMEQLAKADQYNTAGDHRKAAATALAAGAPGAQINQVMNANPGFPVDYSSVQVPVKNDRQDNYQFITKDNLAGQPQTVMVGNKQTGALSEAAVSSLVGNQQPQQQQTTSPGASQESKPKTSQDAFSKIYQSNPQRLQEDTEVAAAQIGTIYKTDDEQLSYLNAMRKTNPMLFTEVVRRLKQKKAPARQ